MKVHLSNNKPSAKLHRGLRFSKSSAPQIERLPPPELLKIRLIQHQGQAANVIVVTGDKVKKGQPLTESTDLSQVPVHASRSGIVSTIDAQFITIITDELDDYKDQPTGAISPPISRNVLIEKLHKHGIAGMGGAGFPAAKKIASLKPNSKLLLINAAECDPIIHCDDALMQSHANEIVIGIKIVADACDITTIVIGIEDNKPAARLAIKQAVDKIAPAIQLTSVPSVYPSGAERTLAQLCIEKSQLSGAENASEPLSASGILSFNVATCYAICQAVVHDIPLTSRIVTVVDAQHKIRNLLLPIGTPITYLSDYLHNHVKLTENHQITTGGHMMGAPISVNDATIKSTNCINFALTERTSNAVKPCIRCNACAEVCPELLLPQQLYMHADSFNEESLQRYRLNRCIECGCCDAVCPSHLPLTASFQAAKLQIIKNQQANTLADIAKLRFEKRQKRLENQDEFRKRRPSGRNSKHTDTQSNVSDADDKKKQLIAAALQRKRRKINTTELANTKPVSPATGQNRGEE